MASNLFKLIRQVNEDDAEDEQAASPDRKNVNATGETATQQVLGQLFSVPSDSDRVVMLLNNADLKERYLTAKGESKIVDPASTTDEQIAAIFSHAGFQVEGGDVDAANAFVYRVQDFDLSSLDKPAAAKRPYAVLLNVSKSVAASLTSKKPTDIEDARKVLATIISHKNYVATLNVAAIKKAGVGALADEHEREDQFNIRTFITAYPVRAVIDAAREEQGDRDKNSKLTPHDDEDGGDAPAQKKPLSRQDLEAIKKIAFAARQVFFAASSKGWPTTPDALKELRDNLVQVLTADERMQGNKDWVPHIVKKFYTTHVKEDRNYNNLLELLKADANFMKLAAGEEPEPEDDDDEATPPVDGEQDATPAADKSAEEVADEIKKKGQDYADEVAKILSGKVATPTPPAAEETPSDLPDDVKAEVERLKKIQKNAINPKQREKAAADLATLLHREEEKKKPKKKR